MARNISEKNTRKEMIDPQLETAGWYLRDFIALRGNIMVTQRGESDERPFELELPLPKELGISDPEVSIESICKAFGGRFLPFARQVLELEAPPDYQEVVQTQPVIPRT